MADLRLTALPPSRRLAVGLFLLLVVLFYGLSQVQLVVAVGDAKSYPAARQVLAKYHGDPSKSRLHHVLDPELSPEDPKSMYAFLSATEAERPALRASVLAWVEAGMPRAGWQQVSHVFTDVDRCASCHRAAGDPPPAKKDLPLETYEQVVAGAGPDRGMSLAELSTSSHNHAMGFAVVALLASLAFTATRWRGPLVPLLVAGAFGGAILDISSWWLTNALGHPWEYGVLVGGGLFGGCTMAMVLLSLDELWLGGRVGALVARVATLARIARRDPA